MRSRFSLLTSVFMLQLSGAAVLCSPTRAMIQWNDPVSLPLHASQVTQANKNPNSSDFFGPLMQHHCQLSGTHRDMHRTGSRLGCVMPNTQVFLLLPRQLCLANSWRVPTALFLGGDSTRNSCDRWTTFLCCWQDAAALV